MKFELEIYERADGSVPLDELMQELSPKLRAKVLRDLDLLEQYGIALREPYTKHLDDDIFELRSILGKDITRCLFFFYSGQKIVVTHGFVKKQSKTPRRELQKAISYRSDWINRKGERADEL